MDSTEIIRTLRMSVTVVRGRKRAAATATILASHIILSLPRSEIWVRQGAVGPGPITSVGIRA
jgi:hypothetical protein